MTMLDFRSGGYERVRGSRARVEFEDAEDRHDDWARARPVPGDAGERLTDQASVLGRVARLTHYLGAIVSVGLMGGLAVWGYQLVVRDVSGVPVIRAVQGDARIAPEDPGGELTDRTGLAVNSVAAGVEARPAQQVAIAPPPTALDGQDVAMGELGATARQPDGVSDAPLAETGEAAVALSDAEFSARAAADAAETAEADGADLAAAVPALPAAEADSAPVGAAVTTVDGTRAQDTAITAALAEAGAAPVAPTRPAPRPRRLAAAGPASDAAPAQAVALAEAPVPADRAEAEATTAEPEVKVAKPSAGAPLVQIGAFDSDALALSEWERVSGRYGALFSGKAPMVQKHRANGRTFYRLRIAGFDSRDDARRFCAALIEAGTDCIPAVAK